MRLSEFIVSSLVFDGGPTVSKREVIQRLLQQLADDGHIPAADAPHLCEAVLKRESLGTTGIGQGIAVPHARYAPLQHPVAIVALCRPPVDFDSLDGEPADLFVLCLAPHNETVIRRRASLHIGESLMRQFRNRDLCERLRRATSAEELRDQFLAADALPTW